MNRFSRSTGVKLLLGLHLVLWVSGFWSLHDTPFASERLWLRNAFGETATFGMFNRAPETEYELFVSVEGGPDQLASVLLPYRLKNLLQPLFGIQSSRETDTFNPPARTNALEAVVARLLESSKISSAVFRVKKQGRAQLTSEIVWEQTFSAQAGASK